MKIITSTGFFNTGSSAIIHLLSEFYNYFTNTGTYEVRLLYDTDCISDLEYNLIENSHRHNTSNAIKKFKKYIDFHSNPLYDHHYERLFKGKFKKLSYEYIDSITDFKYFGEYYGDSYNRGKIFWLINRCYQKGIRLLSKNGVLPHFIKKTLIPKNEIAYAGTIDRNKFLNNTRNYIKNLMSIIEENKEKSLIIDQLIPPSNIKRYLNYIPIDYEIKIFIVDRDPIDLYLLEKYYNNNNVIPVYDVNVFCDWYLWTRNQSTIYGDTNNVMRINFEDLIYKYEETRKKIMEFIGISQLEVCKKFLYFDPQKSINNTQIINRLRNINYEEINIIKKRLQKFLYNFPNNGIKPDYTKFNLFEC